MTGEWRPDPAVAARWEQWCAQQDERAEGICRDTALRDQALRVWAWSEYAAASCERHPDLLPELQLSGDLARPYAGGEMARQLKQALAGAGDEQGLWAALRRFRRRQMVRIIWRDLAGLAPLEEVLEDLTALADACIGAALDHHYDWLCADWGTPRDAEGNAVRMVVLGMGKLGGRELNLSSDIDLIFAYPAGGRVDGRRGQTNEQFFIRLGQKLVKALGSQTADGFVFRVDVRLRPFGEAGPLAVSFDAMEEYYQSQAREWERYAMIKARVVAGDRPVGERLMAMLRPFVYRRYLDFGAIESLRAMKRLISRELARKGMADNIKLGPGGIREIEFIGQAFQLIRGGREPALQIRPILRVLALLGDKGYLPEYAVRELHDAYVFLRRVENRLQAWRDRQTHLLPGDQAARRRLAHSMGYPGWEGFLGVLEGHRRRVQGHFDQVFAAPQAEENGDQALAQVWQGGLEGEAAGRVLAEAGFDDPGAALEQLDALRRSPACRAIGARGRERLDQLMPLLLSAVAATPHPGETLERVARVIEAIARRTAYIALLVESPLALSQLVRLSAASPWIATRLARAPLLFDELLDPRRLYEPLRREALRRELDDLLAGVAADDEEQQMERLRQFVLSNQLRVAAADITGAISLMVVSDYLTEIAEVVIGKVLDLVWADFTARHGLPGGMAAGVGRGFIVVGYGKLGGIELGYGSDLDLVFLHADYPPTAMTDGPKPIPNDLFFTRLAQRIIHYFTTRMPSGILYEVDTRLRPDGASGLLVSGLTAFHRYQREKAWTWEHQALVRARSVAGGASVAADFGTVREAVLRQRRDAGALRREVREMRERMRERLDRSTAHEFDLKQGRGGIADIEFMVQYSVLRWAHEHPGLTRWTDNVRLLDTLAQRGLMTPEAAGGLKDAYRALRAASHRCTLQERPARVPADTLLTQRRQVVTQWRRSMEASESQREKQ